MKKPRVIYMTPRPAKQTINQIIAICAEYFNGKRIEVHSSTEFNELQQKADKLAELLCAIEEDLNVSGRSKIISGSILHYQIKQVLKEYREGVR